MDDIGFGKHLGAFILTIFDFSLFISGLFFIYWRFRNSYLLLLSVALNIASSHYFGTQGIGSALDTINFELWPFINFVFLIVLIAGYSTNKAKLKEKDHSKKEKSQWLKWIFRIVVVLLAPWLFLAIWFLLDSSA